MQRQKRELKKVDQVLNPSETETFRINILTWYDRHRRVLPWRALPGKTPNPYHVWLSEIMLQQTTVPHAIPYFLKFIQKWPDIFALANASTENVMQEWAGLGYYARARNLHKCAKIIAENYNGEFPADQDKLRKLPGIGDYTSAAITSIAFNQPANVVDGNVERVMARYFAVEEPLPASKPHLKKLAAQLSEGREDRPGDYAQALMDLGATICTPKSPSCALCPLNRACMAYAKNLAAELPYKLRPTQKPKRTGYVYWITNDKGETLIHRRPEKGLLGGMVGLPTSEWIERKRPDHPAFLPQSKKPLIDSKAISVFHSFTHFDLELKLCRLNVISLNTMPESYEWSSTANVNEKLPTVFKKAWRMFMAG